MTALYKNNIGILEGVLKTLSSKIFGGQNHGSNVIYINDSFIIYLYSRCTFLLFFVLYAIQSYNWYYKKYIYCFHPSEGRKEPIDEITNFCLSYNYVLKTPSKKHFPDEQNKHYILYYRWIPWMLLILCALYYSPRYIVKQTNCKLSSHFLKCISTALSGKKDKKDEDEDDDEDSWGDNNKIKNKKKTSKNKNFDKEKSSFFVDEDKIAQQIASYMLQHRGNHNSIYMKCLLTHVYSLCINVLGIIIINSTLDNNFLWYIPNNFPFKNRNIGNFSDPIFYIFPPIVNCHIDKYNLGQNYEEVYTCHLILMEIYERYFIVIWLWLFMLMCLNTYYILYLISINIIYIKFLICRRKGKKRFSVGDVYFLHNKIKGLVNSYIFQKVCCIIKQELRNKKDKEHSYYGITQPTKPPPQSSSLSPPFYNIEEDV